MNNLQTQNLSLTRPSVSDEHDPSAVRDLVSVMMISTSRNQPHSLVRRSGDTVPMNAVGRSNKHSPAITRGLLGRRIQVRAKHLQQQLQRALLTKKMANEELPFSPETWNFILNTEHRTSLTPVGGRVPDKDEQIEAIMKKYDKKRMADRTKIRCQYEILIREMLINDIKFNEAQEEEIEELKRLRQQKH